jgi:polar amino acid transport system substrate-binding protein
MQKFDMIYFILGNIFETAMRFRKYNKSEADMMKKFKRTLGLILAGAMLMGVVGCGSTQATSDSTGDDTQAQAETTGGVITWGTNAEFPPYEYREGGEVVGIDADIMDAIAAKLGMTAEVEDMNFDSIIASIQSGKVDVGMAGMTVTEDRAKMVNFTDSYATATQVIVVKDGSDIKSADDLTGKTIGVQLGTTGDLYAADIEGASLERFNKGSEAVIALTQDKVDAVVIDNEPAQKFVASNEGIVILDEPLTVEEYAIAVNQDNTELLDQINGALAELKESGELQEIIDKYISAE